MDVPSSDDPGGHESGIIVTLSGWQARQGMYTTSIKRWERYGDLLQSLNDALDKYGAKYL